ncbi:hypothetical protein RUM44_006009 [Polyplax serrata]|uniref:Uncharacterized protein n=1 Tax=Polyplax serrata TaxID=468196 RepID=A0ABR1AZ73_POLSC
MRAEKKVQQKKDDVKTFSELPCTTLAFKQTFLTMFHPFADDRLEWQELEKAPEELHGYHGKVSSDVIGLLCRCDILRE